MRGKLLAMSALVAIVAIGTTGYLAYQKGSTSIVDALCLNFEGVAASTMDKIDREFSDRVSDVQAFAAHDLAAGITRKQVAPGVIRTFANSMTRLYGVYDAMVIVDRQGRVLATSSVSPEGKAFDPTPLEQASFASADWFKTCVSGSVKIGSAVVGAPEYNGMIQKAYGEKKISMTIAAPIRDTNGQVVGVWCNFLAYHAVVQSITDRTIAYYRANGFPSFRVTIIDHEGVIIDDEADKDVLSKNLAKAGQSRCVERLLAGENGSTVEKSVRFGYTQVNGFALSKGAGAYTGEKWGLLVRAKTDDALAAVFALRDTLLLVGAMILVIVIAFVFFFSRRLVRPIARLSAAADRLALGDADVEIDATARDEVGLLAGSFHTLAVNIREQAAVAERIASGDLSVAIQQRSDKDVMSIALARATASLRGLVAEAGMLSKAAVEGKLATRGNAEKFQGGYREIVQGVNNTLDAVIGPLNVAAEYVDRIAKGDIPAKITDNYNGDFNEIKNNLNQAIGAVNALVADAVMLSKAAVEGKLATRADATKHGGDFRKIVQGVNETLDAVIGPLNVAAEYVDRISKGDIPAKITDNYNGDFNEIKNNLNQAIGAVNALVADAVMLSKAAVEGKLATRADATKHGGDFRKIVQGVNETLDAVIGPLNVAAEYVDRISKGDIPAKITDNYNGDFNEIKNNLNQAIDAVNVLVADAVMLSQAAVEGTSGDTGRCNEASGRLPEDRAGCERDAGCGDQACAGRIECAGSDGDG